MYDRELEIKTETARHRQREETDGETDRQRGRLSERERQTDREQKRKILCISLFDVDHSIVYLWYCISMVLFTIYADRNFRFNIFHERTRETTGAEQSGGADAIPPRRVRALSSRRLRLPYKDI